MYRTDDGPRGTPTSADLAHAIRDRLEEPAN
jgi:hypothetical protein